MLPVGCVPSAAVAVPWGVSAAGGVSVPGQWCLPGGGGCLLPAGSARPHPVDRMTDVCENIYFPHLLLRTVKIEGHCLTLNESISISPFDVD